MKTLDDATRTTKLEPEILEAPDLDADDRGDRPNMGPPVGSRMSTATVVAYERCIASLAAVLDIRRAKGYTPREAAR